MVGQKNPQLLGMIWPNSVFKGNLGDFLVIQWLRIHLPLDKGTQVRSLVQKLKIPHPAKATEPTRHDCWANRPQPLKPTCLEPMLP